MDSAATRIKNIMIGKSLQSKREVMNLSRSELSKKLNVSPQFIANWERGQCLPPKKVIPLLMSFFNMTPEEMVNLYTNATKEALKEYFESLETSDESEQE